MLKKAMGLCLYPVIIILWFFGILGACLACAFTDKEVAQEIRKAKEENERMRQRLFA